MRRKLCLILGLVTLFSCAATTRAKADTGGVKSGLLDAICILDGVKNATLAAAVACAGTNGVIEIPMFAVPTLTGDVTVPAGVTLHFWGSSPGLVPLGNFNLAINGPLEAPRAQIFSYTGSGVVSFGLNSSTTLFPEWFGAKGDGVTDDRAALQDTWNAAKIGTSAHDATHAKSILPISLGCKTYLVASAPGLNFTNTDEFHIEGCNQFTSQIQVNFTGLNTVGVDISADFAGIFRNMAVICGTSASNAPTVCVLHARSDVGNSSNGILEQFQNVSIQGFSPWIYYNYRAEQATFIDSQLSENATAGTPVTISAVNSAGITSPNVKFGGANSATLYTFHGAAMVINSSATAPNSKLLYLDEGSSIGVIQSVWYEGFYNEQGTNEAFIADTAGATGQILNIVLLGHGNTTSNTNVVAKMTGTAYQWTMQGQHDPPDSTGAPALQFTSLQRSIVRFTTNVTNCATVGNAAGSIIIVDPTCTSTFPEAIVSNGTSVVFSFAPGTTFTSLGAPSNGTVVYCNDCTIANPCTGSGTGAIAKRLNGVWVCN